MMYFCRRKALVAKLVDAPDLGSGVARRVGSSPIRRTFLADFPFDAHRKGFLCIHGEAGECIWNEHPDLHTPAKNVGRVFSLPAPSLSLLLLTFLHFREKAQNTSRLLKNHWAFSV